MPPERVPFLDLKRQCSSQWTAAAVRVVESGWFIDGPELAAFESAFATYCGAAQCIGVANGTDALELALRAAGVQPDDEVATVANAGMYSTTAIRAIGATPVFVDIDAHTMLMSPESLQAAVGPRTRAIVVTHLYGAPAPLEALFDASRGLPVIEDCAQAHGRAVSSRVAAACFSFYPTKNLGALGDAGAVVTSDETLAPRVRALRQYGWTSRFHSSLAGGRNSRMDELQAAVLGARLPFLDEGNQRRRDIAQRYCSAIGGRYTFRPPELSSGHLFHLFVLRCERRDELKQRLEARGVQTQIHYPVPDHLQLSQTRLPFRAVRLAETEAAVDQVLSLPCYPQLLDEEVKYVIASLLECHDEFR